MNHEKPTNLTKWLVITTILISVSTIIISLSVISSSYYRVFFQDEWVNTSFYFDRGFWGSVFYRHNSHPVILPNLFFRLDYIFMDASGQARAWATTITSAVAALGVALLAVRNSDDISASGRLIRYAAATVIVSFGVWLGIGQKLIWVFGITDYLVTFGAVVSSFGLVQLIQNKYSDSFAATSLLFTGSIIATCSFGSGLATWAAFSAILLLSRAPLKLILAYLFIGSLTVYLVMFVMPGNGSGQLPVKGINLNIFENLIFITTVIGNIFINVLLRFRLLGDPETALIYALTLGSAGSIYLAYSIYSSWNEHYKDTMTAGLQALALVALGAASLVSIARTGGTAADLALAPRYAPMSLFFWMALLGLIVRKVTTIRQHKESGSDQKPSCIVYSVFLLIIAIGIFSTNYISVFYFKKMQERSIIAGLSILVDPSPYNNNISLAFRKTDFVLSVSERLRKENKDIFRLPLNDLLAKPLIELTKNQEIKGVCLGQIKQGNVMQNPPPGQFNSIILYGWSKTRESNIPVNEVFIVQDGVIVGGGISSPILSNPWLMNAAKSGSIISKFTIKTLQLLSWAFNIPDGGWIAAVKAKSVNIPNLDYYGRLSNGSLCKIEFD